MALLTFPPLSQRQQAIIEAALQEMFDRPGHVVVAGKTVTPTEQEHLLEWVTEEYAHA